jgi:hypothetical protein
MLGARSHGRKDGWVVPVPIASYESRHGLQTAWNRTKSTAWCRRPEMSRRRSGRRSGQRRSSVAAEYRQGRNARSILRLNHVSLATGDVLILFIVRAECRPSPTRGHPGRPDTSKVCFFHVSFCDLNPTADQDQLQHEGKRLDASTNSYCSPPIRSPASTRVAESVR